eukprot:m.199129 g.199129  ORF g.199129 m.199129 type:complete len:496 (+) comp17679_c0_seq10:3413-4900(+)
MSSDAADAHLPEFIAAETFTESKDGYAFRAGDQGTGYYLDHDALEKAAGDDKSMTRHQRLMKLREEGARRRQQERIDAEKKREEKLAAKATSTNKNDEALSELQTRMHDLAVAGQAAAEEDEIKIEYHVKEMEGERWGLRARLTGGPVIITTVTRDSEGHQKGVQVGDVIVEISGISVEANRETALELIKKGGKHTVKFERYIGRRAQMVGIGGDASTIVQGGTLSKEEEVKLQAMLGSAKNKDTVAYFGKEGVTEVIAEGAVESKACLVFAGCKSSTFTINATCTKIFLQDCHDVIFNFNGRVLTSTFEAFRCTDLSLNFDTKVGTLQIDMCTKVTVVIVKKEHFFESHGVNGSMLVWAGCHDLQLSIKDSGEAIATGFAQMKEEYHDLVEERSQFRIKYEKNSAGDFKLMQNRIVRLANGFFSTAREKAIHEEREEAMLRNMAASMGITINKAKPQGIKCKPNEPCPHGSGKKYKKCCNRLDGICTGNQGEDW